MLEASFHQVGSSAQLTGAILIYSGKEERLHEPFNPEHVAYSTIHRVEAIQGRPEIMPGRLMTQADLNTLAGDLTSAKAQLGAQWIEDEVLATGKDRKVWWTPPGKRAMFFQYDANEKKAFEGNGECAVPGLVWMSMNPDNDQKTMYVYAYKGDGRPTQETQLYQAPFFNVWSRGKVCIGSAQLPRDDEVGRTTVWEQTFFGSRFTHPNFTEKDRLLKGVDPVNFWKKQLASPAARFPEKHLVPLPLTVGDLLDCLLLDRLAKIPKAQGEF